MAVIVVVTVASIWAYGYFNTKVFYLDGHQYLENTSKIRIDSNGEFRELQIDGETYRLKELESTEDKVTYQVAYPNGNVYTVEDVNHSGFLMAYDKKGDLVLEVRAYSNGGRILSPGEEYYSPSSLVAAAYDKYYEKQGNVFIFILSVLFFVYSWFLFRKERLQRIHFKLSYRLWVVDPEPSEFYFFMTKVGAVVGMVLSGLFVLYSLK